MVVDWWIVVVACVAASGFTAGVVVALVKQGPQGKRGEMGCPGPAGMTGKPGRDALKSRA